MPAMCERAVDSRSLQLWALGWFIFASIVGEMVDWGLFVCPSTGEAESLLAWLSSPLASTVSYQAVFSDFQVLFRSGGW